MTRGGGSLREGPVLNEFGIRWAPTISGALFLIGGVVWIAAGLANPSKSATELLLGFASLVLGVGLVRWGRRGLVRSLRSMDRNDSPH